MSNPMASAAPTPAGRREGLLVGAVIGSALAARTADTRDAAVILARLPGGAARPLAPAPGTRRAATALADALMEELLSGGVDLRRLGQRWVTWWREEGGDAEPRLAEALAHLREFDAPLPPPAPATMAAMAAVLPAALTAGASPQGMVRGAFHVASMLDPTETGALAAAAVAVAASHLLEGRRDFLPDVIAMLRANDAPAALLEPVRAIPRDPRTAPPRPVGEQADPGAALAWILWTVHHRPKGADELEKMVLAGGVSPVVGAVLGALLGARDGLDRWPRVWFDESGEEVVLRRGLAQRLS